MRRTAIIVAFAASLAPSNVALAEECAITWFPYLYLTPQRVEFEESASRAKLTLHGTAIGEPVVFDLDREILTLKTGNTSETRSALVGDETIRAGNAVNELRFILWDKTKPSGNRAFGLNVTILVDGFEPYEESLGGVLDCR